MTADDHACVPVTDDEGRVVARARVSPDLGEEGRRALLNVVAAAVRVQEERDAADPEGAAERDRRYAAGQERIRARNVRLRGQVGPS